MILTKKLTAYVLTLVLCLLPCVVYGSRPLNSSLRELKNELQASYRQLPEMQAYFDEEYAQRHQEMLDVISTSNEQSILLYTQEHHMTFDMSYVLKKVTSEYKAFNENRRPYDQSVIDLNYEIDRYARLIEALRRLPPRIKKIKVSVVPDSLLYRNDSLEMHLSKSSTSLEKEIFRVVNDTAYAPFVLDQDGQKYRDTCIFYASELLKTYATNRTTILRDSSHYQETYLRMKENYDYAEERYRELQEYVFSEGQISFVSILTHFKPFIETVKQDLASQFDTHFFEDNEDFRLDDMSSSGAHVMLLIGCFLQLVALVMCWLLVFGVLWLVYRFAYKKQSMLRKQLPLFSVLAGTALYVLLFRFLWNNNEYLQMGVHNINTFLWLLIAITGSLLLRGKPDQIRHGLWLYAPAFFMAFVIIVCRNAFVPDSLMALIFPPILLLVIIRQLLFCINKHSKADKIDSRLGWASLLIYIVAFVFAFLGYTFVCLLILVWWYFQLAVLLAVVCVADLLERYKSRWLDKRVDAMRERITYVGGEERESLLFGATWLYDLVRQVWVPVLLVFSLPMCAHLSLNIFDFNDLFIKYYTSPFVSVAGNDGVESLCISAQSVVYLITLLLVLRYMNRAIHAIWQYARYTLFMRKYNRTSIRSNEINLSLGNSIITVLVWMIFAIIVVVELKIPTGSLGLVAGGLSAGIGLALKDIINNFIYGIQLMGGRLRVGDWIECDGVRGKVTAINYQCVQVETIDGTEMSFLNASLFGKNFNNLTRNNSYELTKITVGVAYGTDVDKAREVLVKAMQKMCTKDRYGREIVAPKPGVYVIVDEMADSAVVIGVKQMVLVAERISYVERAKEVIYNALNEAGITIAFPQCDVHLIQNG